MRNHRIWVAFTSVLVITLMLVLTDYSRCSNNKRSIQGSIIIPLVPHSWLCHKL